MSGPRYDHYVASGLLARIAAQTAYGRPVRRPVVGPGGSLMPHYLRQPSTPIRAGRLALIKKNMPA